MSLRASAAAFDVAIAKLAARAEHEITELTLIELSLVDRPAAPLPGEDHNVLVLKRDAAPAAVVRVLKADSEKQILVGVALTPGVVDRQGDRITAEVIEAAAHAFMRKSRSIGLQHEKRIDDKAGIVESWIAPSELTIGGYKVSQGSWVVSVQIDDHALWKRVRSGDITGLSIGGTAKKTPVRKSNGGIDRLLLDAGALATRLRSEGSR